MSNLPDDFFENKDWKLVVRPVWIRKNNEKEIRKCIHCNGVGKIMDYGECLYDGHYDPCINCYGTGKVEQLKEIDPAPDLSSSKYQEFREALQKFMNDFGK